MEGPGGVTWDDPVAQAADLVARLEAVADPANVAGMARYGISEVGTLGVSVSVVRGFSKELRRLRRSRPDYVHAVAEHLWASGVHEARLLAVFIDPPALVTSEQADRWVADIDSWDTCDQACNLFAKTDFAYDKVIEWTSREEVFVRRAGFVMVCSLAVHDKQTDDARIIALLDFAERAAADERNFVKKAVSWAIRGVGKRSLAGHTAAVACAERILATQSESKSARWIARDALRELRSEAVLARVGAISVGV